MTYRVKLSELASMSGEQREETLSALVSAAQNPPEAARRTLEARIRRYELRYEMSSDEMRRRVAAGRQPETAEIAKWLFLLGVRDSKVSAG